MSKLPPLLAEIASVAGEQAALKLAQARGGTQVYIPARAPDGHWLVQCVGREAADKICAHFAVLITGDGKGEHHGAHVKLPLGGFSARGAARRTAIAALEAGASLSQAARASGLDQRTVEMIKARMKGKTSRGPAAQGRLL